MTNKPADALASLDVTKRPGPQPTLKAKRRRTAAQPEAIRQLTLYLNEGAHRALRQLALDRDVKAHALLIEAVNLMFVKYGRKPVAVQRTRSAKRPWPDQHRRPRRGETSFT